MSEQEKPTGPLDFEASFPPDGRFAWTAAELSARLAQATGCSEGDSLEIREAVGGTFQAALDAGAGETGAAAIDLALHATDRLFATDLTCGTRTLLHLTHPRPA